jgi:CheY-like chemotaxis protein
MEERIVLFVDDEEKILSSFRRIFSDEPYKTFFAKNGEEALEILLHQEVHVVLLDIRMPGLNGYETCSRIKSDTNCGLTQVIRKRSLK